MLCPSVLETVFQDPADPVLFPGDPFLNLPVVPSEEQEEDPTVMERQTDWGRGPDGSREAQ